MPSPSLPPASGVHPIDGPRYGAGPLAAVVRFYRAYGRLSGRSSRSELVWAGVFLTLVYLVGAAQTFAYGSREVGGWIEPGPFAVPFAVVFVLGNAVPALALCVRRLHDANLSGALSAVYLAPYLGPFALLLLCLLPSDPAGARFDADGVLLPGPPAAPSPPPAPPAPAT